MGISKVSRKSSRIEKKLPLRKFELLEELGQGSTATVYKARQRASGEVVAVKLGAGLLTLDQAVLERFRREFTVIRHLRHPNLVAALEIGEENQIPYLVLEYVNGPSLEKRLQEEGPMPPADALAVILQVAEGLRFLHDNQVLHRDIKPGNIYLDADGQAKLGDFGLLKMLTADHSADPSLTKSHKAMGTLEYGAPEQFEDAKRTDVRCDIYALAGTLYTAMTGLFPFGVGSQMRMLRRKFQNQVFPLGYLLPRIPGELDEFLARALHAERQQRPATMAEFIATLTRVRAAVLALPAPRELPRPPFRTDAGSGKERRTAVRVTVTLPVAFVPFHEHQRGTWKATIADVSEGGLCLQTRTLSPINTLLEVTDPTTGVSRLAQVRWLQKTPEQEYLLGCSFIRPLEAGEVETFLPPKR
jgi:serine/threonine protein kinase